MRDARVRCTLVVYRPVTCSMDWIATNIFTYDSGVLMDIGSISFQLVLGGCGHVWRSPDYVNTPDPLFPSTS